MPQYKCVSETKKPTILLVQEPGEEIRLAKDHPTDWGFDPSLAEDTRSFEKLIRVPDGEQKGTYGWGSNILPLGNYSVISSTHLRQTNRNLQRAGFTVIDIPSTTLTQGFGSFHCMTAYLR